MIRRWDRSRLFWFGLPGLWFHLSPCAVLGAVGIGLREGQIRRALRRDPF